MDSCQVLWKRLRESRWVACGFHVRNRVGNRSLSTFSLVDYVDNCLLMREYALLSGKSFCDMWEKFIDWLTNKIHDFHVFHIAYNYYYLYIKDFLKD